MGIFTMVAVAIIAVFTVATVSVWSENRRKEREAFHKHETYRKLIDQPGEAADAILAMMRQEKKEKEDSVIWSLKLGGLITTAAGLGLGVFLFFLDPDEGEPIYLVGLIPLLVGAAMSLYAFVLAPERPTSTKEEF